MSNDKNNDKKKSIDEIAASCSDCGNCLFSCPVYNVELAEPYAPRGRVNLIKSLRDGRLEANRHNRDYIYRCLLCGSCQHICTKDVDFVGMMIDYRGFASQGKNIPWLKKLVLYFYQSFLFKHAGLFIDILAKTGLRKKILLPRRRKGNFKRWQHHSSQQDVYDILLFPGCVLTYFHPGIIEKTAAFLEKQGFSVVIPRGLSCCGFPYLSQGWTEKMKVFREKNLEIFSRFRFKYLVVPCGTGVMTFRNFYGLEDPSSRVYELTQFFYEYLRDVPVRKDIEFPVTFHDPCHHLKTLGLGRAPRHFLQQYRSHFLDDSSGLCCGFGGIFSVGFPATSRKILQRREEELEKVGAKTVFTSCPGCYLHLKERLSPIFQVKHFIDMFE